MDGAEQREAPAPGTAAAGRVALPRDVGAGGGWTVLVPSAAAAEWAVLTMAGGRTGGGQAAAGATAATDGFGGGGGGGVPEVAIEMAALLATLDAGGRGFGVPGAGRGVAGGDLTGGGGAGGGLAGGSGAGGPHFVPVVFIPSFKQESKEDKGLSVAKVIYGLLLFGPLGFVTPVNNALADKKVTNLYLWYLFGLCWGLLSIGFHMSLHGGLDQKRRAYIQHLAHFSLMLFCSFVIYYLYLLMPSSKESLLWLIDMEWILVTGHILAWFWVTKETTVTREASTQDNRGSRVSQEGFSMWERTRQGLARVTQGCAGVRQV